MNAGAQVTLPYSTARPIRIGVLCQPADAATVGQGGNLDNYVNALAANGAEPVTLEIPKQYADLVRANGNDAFKVPLPDGLVQAITSQVDGLLIPGGSDVDPRFYEAGARNGPGPKTIFDAYELAIIKHALGIGMPMLGICRGMQLMYVAGGGTLIKDIPTQLQRPKDRQYEHQQRNIGSLFGDMDRPVHPVTIEEEGLGRPSVLRSLLDTTAIAVNSAHHQCASGIDQEKLPYAITARAPDGVIEGMESRTNPTQWAIQWHPERQRRDSESREDDSYDRFFQKLITDSAKYKGVQITVHAANQVVANDAEPAAAETTTPKRKPRGLVPRKVEPNPYWDAMKDQLFSLGR
jgi:putative glutamine amidotransferase